MKLRAVAAVIAMLGSFSAQSSVLSPEASNYDHVFPLYAEECAFTQYIRKGQAAQGTGGHAALYLKGVCYDGSEGYPRLKLCDELAQANSLADVPKSKLEDPDWGVGVSVDKDFTNVNWVAVPTKSLFLFGNHPKKVDVATIEQTIQAMTPYYKGIEGSFKDFEGIRPDESHDEKLIEDGLGTDFAVTFARKAFCQRLPMGKESLQAMIDFLNAKQDDAHEKGNVWDGMNNNCAHTAHNAIASTGIRNKMLDLEDARFRGIGHIILDAVTAPFFFLANQIATPANEFITLSRLTTLNVHDMNPKRLYKNDKLRAAVMDPLYGSLPKEVGSIAEIVPQVDQDHNDIYVSPVSPVDDWIILDFPPVDTIVQQIPGIGVSTAKKIDKTGLEFRHREFNEIVADDSIYTNPRARLEYFREFYRKVQRKYLRKNAHPDDPDYTAYFERYQSLIAERLELIDSSLAPQGAQSEGVSQPNAQTQAGSE